MILHAVDAVKMASAVVDSAPNVAEEVFAAVAPENRCPFWWRRQCGRRWRCGRHGPIVHRSTPFGVDDGGWLVFRRLKPTATRSRPLRGRHQTRRPHRASLEFFGN